MTVQTSDRLRNSVATRAQNQPEQQQGKQPTIYQLIDQQRTEIARAIPKHMNADRLARVVVTVMRTNPKLLECSPQSLLAALMLSAQTGLEPGPLGHCYWVPFWNSKLRTFEVTWIIGYKGIVDLARRSGQMASIEAREVCANDDFEFEYGLDEKLVHRPNMTGDRGPIVAFYGIARFTDGGRYILVMSKADVDQHRNRSKSKDNGPWITDYPAMGRKTVIRAMAPFLPLTIESAQALAADEHSHRGVTKLEDVGTVVDVDPATGEIGAGSADPAQLEPTEEDRSGWPPVEDMADDEPDHDAVSQAAREADR